MQASERIIIWLSITIWAGMIRDRTQVRQQGQERRKRKEPSKGRVCFGVEPTDIILTKM